jgi:hypothetical protein
MAGGWGGWGGVGLTKGEGRRKKGEEVDGRNEGAEIDGEDHAEVAKIAEV